MSKHIIMCIGFGTDQGFSKAATIKRHYQAPLSSTIAGPRSQIDAEHASRVFDKVGVDHTNE